jgi:hypothetical protein
MGSPTSVTTENPEPRRLDEAGSKGTSTASTAVVNAAYSDERPSKGQWYSEAPPTGALTWVLGELAFYYGACCLYHRSAPPPLRRPPYY